MTNPIHNQSRTIGWMGIHRGHKARPLEWIVEKGIFTVALSSILMVFLIFLFIAREALPVLLGRMDSSAAKTANVIPSSKIDTLKPEELRAYLGLTPAEFKSKDRDTLILLMDVRAEAAAEAPTSRDASINTISWRHLLLPYQWEGYAKPSYIWQPVGNIQKYNLVPLLLGSLKTTLVALLFAIPVSIGAALYVSQLCPPRFKEWVKPAIELLSGIPSVVLGFFALMVMASAFQTVFGYANRLNAVVAGIALGIASIPVCFSIAEDALTSVPRAYSQAALALGATRWQTTWQIVLPAAIPGVFAAIVLGFGRAIGETIVVLMASGNASILSLSLLDSTRTLTATIAAEISEAVSGGPHYRLLFVLGIILFLITFVSNLLGEWVIHRLKARLEGRR